MNRGLELNRQLITDIFGQVEKFLATSGCPLTPDQRGALAAAVDDMGSYPAEVKAEAAA